MSIISRARKKTFRTFAQKILMFLTIAPQLTLATSCGTSANLGGASRTAGGKPVASSPAPTKEQAGSINSLPKKEGTADTIPAANPDGSKNTPALANPPVKSDPLIGTWKSYCAEVSHHAIGSDNDGHHSHEILYQAYTFTADGKKGGLGLNTYTDPACKMPLNGTESLDALSYKIGKEIDMPNGVITKRNELDIVFDSDPTVNYTTFAIAKVDVPNEVQLVLTDFGSSPTNRSSNSYLKFVKVGG